MGKSFSAFEPSPGGAVSFSRTAFGYHKPAANTKKGNQIDGQLYQSQEITRYSILFLNASKHFERVCILSSQLNDFGKLLKIKNL